MENWRRGRGISKGRGRRCIGKRGEWKRFAGEGFDQFPWEMEGGGRLREDNEELGFISFSFNVYKNKK